MKCDEGRPDCKRFLLCAGPSLEQLLTCLTRCLDLNLECAGYRVLTISKSSFREYHPKIKHSVPALHGVRPALITATTPRQDVRHLLDYYQHQISHQLGGFMDNDFWSVTIPQLGQSEPAVTFAVAAISATFRKFQSTGASYHEVMRDTACSDGPSLEFYNIALAKTCERVAQHDGRLMATLTCMLFLCMEFLQSNKQQSKRLFDRLCQLLRLGSDREGSWAKQLDLIPNLRSMYQRIVLQSLLFAHPIPPYHYQDWKPQLCNLPTVFHSLSEARDALYQLLAVIHDFCKLARTNSEPGRKDSTAPVTGPEEQAYLLSTLGEWRKTFRQWCANNDLRGAGISQSVSLLRMYDHVTMAWLMNPWESSQSPFDNATEYFKLVVEEASSILAMAGSKSELSSTLHFEMGVMPPLYFTAIKCRCHELRHHALSLLRQAPRREGLWDREELVAIAERVIAVETAAVSSPGIPIPDADRVCDVFIEQQDKGNACGAIFSFRAKGFIDTTSQTRQSWVWDPSRGKFVLCI